MGNTAIHYTPLATCELLLIKHSVNSPPVSRRGAPAQAFHPATLAGTAYRNWPCHTGRATSRAQHPYAVLAAPEQRGPIHYADHANGYCPEGMQRSGINIQQARRTSGCTHEPASRGTSDQHP